MQFQGKQFLKKKKGKNRKASFLKCVDISTAGMKAQWDEGDGRILLGDNIGCVAVLLRPIRFRCAGVWTSKLDCL